MVTFLIWTSPLTIYIGMKLLDRFVSDRSKPQAPKPTLEDLFKLLPYVAPATSDEQDAQNTVALVWFATHQRDTRGSLAQQVMLHEQLNS